jgi:glucose-6-phosphate isomerase
LNGALELSESLIGFDKDKLHKTEIFAALHFLGYLKRSQKIHILIPYSFRLKEFGFWFRQLWAESLGKKDSNLGDEIYVGPTPVAALGATDQHSQFQLYYFGPFDKIITFIDVEDPGHDALIPDSFPEIDGVSYMSGLSFNKIIRTELAASSMALTERKRANGRIILPEISAFTLGQLIQFFEITTSYMGELLSINAYDQPGVELGKQNMYALFDRSGFHTRKIELENLTKNFGTDVVE